VSTAFPVGTAACFPDRLSTDKLSVDEVCLHPVPGSRHA
jgi:hypothetical protein